MWIPGFSLWRVWVDAMHTLDLGVYQIVCACALVELVEERVWPCATHEEGITKAYREYKAWCKSVGTTPCHKFKWKKILNAPDGPELTQHQAKAAQMRWLVRWLHEVTSTKGRGEGRHCALRRILF